MIRICKAIDALNDWFGKLIAPVIAIITLIVIYDITLRYFWGRPSDWAFDITKMLFGAYFMLLTAYGMRHCVHAEVDIVKRLLSHRVRTVTDLVGYLIFFTPFVWLLLTYGWDFAARSWSRGETTYGMVSIPIYPLKAVIVVTGVLILLQGVSIVLRLFRELKEDGHGA
ncbi:C4-dicarboxylate ABC transporter permease [Marinobacter sp. B9-2]|nr:C4-dicarboxylate ABC transporter permease [Marinobacter sp. B9-2]